MSNGKDHIAEKKKIEEDIWGMPMIRCEALNTRGSERSHRECEFEQSQRLVKK